MQKVTSPRSLLSPKKSTCPLRQADPPGPEARDRQQRAYLDACVDLHRLLGRAPWLEDIWTLSARRSRPFVC
jgi:hypothetical protein